MLSVIYAECRKKVHYAECRYVESRYGECRGAQLTIIRNHHLIIEVQYNKTLWGRN
jgi:hypothetical protein